MAAPANKVVCLSVVFSFLAPRDAAKCAEMNTEWNEAATGVSRELVNTNLQRVVNALMDTFHNWSRDPNDNVEKNVSLTWEGSQNPAVKDCLVKRVIAQFNIRTVYRADILRQRNHSIDLITTSTGKGVAAIHAGRAFGLLPPPVVEPTDGKDVKENDQSAAAAGNASTAGPQLSLDPVEI